MQAQGQIQRQIPRRSPNAEPPSSQGRSMSPMGAGPSGPGSLSQRPSTTSTRSIGGPPPPRRTNTSGGSASGSSSSSSAPLSQIEKSVTHLLVATKQLLETLTQWSHGQATDTQVSDVYVRLGYEFNMACRAFTAINVDTADLGNVPELLRNILEATLSQEASSESLDKYLPRIRDIIINLLHGLKRKQQKLRQKTRERESNATVGSMDSVSGRTASVSTSGSAGSGLANMLNEGIENGYRDPSQPSHMQPRPPEHNQQLPPMRDEHRQTSPSRRYAPVRDPSRVSATSEQSSLSSTTMQNMPVLPPHAGDASPAPAADLNIDAFPPPPPPKSQQSALMALQRNGEHLERRASRRYSQYQIHRHLGSSFSSGVPLLPPQTTPIPNRGRGDVRESMRAVQGRNDGRSAGRAGNDASSPMRVPSRVTEERDMGADGLEVVTAIPTDYSRYDDSPNTKTPEDKYARPSATLRGPPTDLMPAMPPQDDIDDELKRRVVNGTQPQGSSDALERSKTLHATEAALVGGEAGPATAAGRQEQGLGEASATATQAAAAAEPESKALTLFLQYKSKVKKFVLAEGYSELTIGRLQLAFIDKFSWNTQQDGADLPEIYIQDPVSGVRHELEDLSDIKDRTVLALNVEPLDEVKRHFDEGIGALKSIVQQVKQNVDEQGAALQRVSDRQQESSKEMARLAALPATTAVSVAAAAAAAAAPSTSEIPRAVSVGSAPAAAAAAGRVRRPTTNLQQVVEIQNLRRDLAVLRQTYSDFQSDIQSSMTALRNKASNVKKAAAEAVIPDVDSGQGQAIVAAGRKKLNAESDRLVTKVDDLQDLVEDLRKDVVHRGVRPLPRQLEEVTKDITQLAKDLTKMKETIKQDKPVWTKIWEKELEEVCKGQDELKMAEELLVDLEDDLEKASETLALVEQATKEQMKDAGANGGVAHDDGTGSGNGSGTGTPSGGGGGGGGGGGTFLGRQISRGLKSIGALAGGGGVDPNAAKEGVLGEVRALQVNHENRLEAIERAEKLRQKELQSRRVNPLMRELSDFVEEGKLKKSGGYEEVERARKAKDERIRREVWERQNGVVLDVPPEGEEEGEGAEAGADAAAEETAGVEEGAGAGDGAGAGGEEAGAEGAADAAPAAEGAQ